MTKVELDRPKVSVIIPVYGVEKYIEKCARSLFEQTLDDMEFIFVDDCTPDNSFAVLERVIEDYPKRKPQTKILHHEVNKGLPITRQTGIRAAKGKFIAHCDSDDWVDVNMYADMYAEAEKSNADIVVCDSYMVIDGNLTLRKGCIENITSKDAIRNMVLQKIPWSVWNKLVKHDLYIKHDFVFPTRTHSEDMAFSLQLFYYASNISYIPKPFYYYVSNSSIPTHIVNEQLYLKRFNEAVENVKCVENFFNAKGENELVDYVIYLKLIQRDNLLPILFKKKYFSLWKNTFPEINNEILFNKVIRIKHKLKYLMIRCHLGWVLVKMGRID